MRSNNVSKIFGAMILLLGATVLTAWFFQFNHLIQIIPNTAPMQPNTALCFILVGLRLLLIHISCKMFIKRMLSMTIGIIALLTLFEYIANVQLPIDNFLISNNMITANTSHIGRMAPNTALCFLLLSISLCLSEMKEKLQFLGIFLASLVFVIGVLAFSGYILEIKILYGWGNFTRMALHTSLGMILASSSILYSLFAPDFKNLPLKKIRNYIFVYGIISIFTISIFSAVLTFLPLFQKLGDYEKENLISTISDKANAIDQYFYELRNISKLISSRTYLNDIQAEYESNKITLDQFHAFYQRNLEEVLKATHKIEGVARFNLQNNKIFEIGTIPPLEYPKLISNYSPQNDYEVYSWINDDKELHLVYLNRVFNKENKLIGTDIVSYNTERIEKILKDTKTFFSSLQIILEAPFNKQRIYLQITKDNLRVSEPKNNRNFKIALQNSLSNKSGIVDRVNGVLTPEMYAYVPLQESGWILFGEIDAEEIYKGINKPLFHVLIFLGSFIFIFIIGYLVIINPLTGGILIQESKLEEKIQEKTKLLERSRAQLQSILDNTTAFIYVKSLEGKYQLVNKQFEILFKTSAEETYGKTDFEIFSHNIAKQLWENDCKVIEKNEAIQFEESILLKDGMHHYISIKFPLKELNGSAYAVCSISTDISLQKHNIDEIQRNNLELELKNKKILENSERLEYLQISTLNILEDLQSTKDRLLKSENELLRSNKELEQFAYVASHDLQEPLRKIMAFGERLETKLKDRINEEERDYLSRMTNASLRMKNLIEDLLTYSRVTTHQQPYTEINLNQILKEVLSDLETTIEQSGGKVEVGELGLIEADPLQMRQLFQNLIANALKFHKAGKGSHVQIKSENKDDKMILTITDDGIGFDIKFKDRIFQPFQRLHGKSEYEGTGIGLAVCQKIVERHHGNIQVNSEEGKGTCFVITLPLKK